MKKGTLVEATVVDFTAKGNGLAVTELGKKVEIPYTIVGEKITASVTGKRKGVFRGRLESIQQTSEKRVQPQCVHFGSCGGCRWQHLSYAEQLKVKQQFIENCFGNLAKDTQCRPIVACDPPWRYRNKMEFTFSQTRSGERYLGLVKEGIYRDVFNLKECHLCAPWIVKVADASRLWWEESALDAYNGRAGTGSLRTLTLREGMRTGDKMVLLTVSGNPDYALTREQLNSFVASVRSLFEKEEQQLSIFLRIYQSIKGQSNTFFDMHLYGNPFLKEELQIPLSTGTQTLQFHISPGAFFQPNTFQAEKLYAIALELAALKKTDHVFDLYCGTGTLGIAASLLAGKVTGIEISAESALDGNNNAALNGCQNVDIRCASVNTELEILRKEGENPDLVMVDPPRAGLDPKAISHILEIGAPRLIYVSCNPQTQAANIQELVDGGYRLDTMQAVDQFPHTAHVEHVARLLKDKNR